MFDHGELVLRADKWLQSQGFTVTLRDGFSAWTTYGEKPDAIGWRDYYSCLIECKSTRADFLADRKKQFRAEPHLGMGDWRFYMCPPGVIHVDDLPDSWGLLYCHPRKVEKVHGYPPAGRWDCMPFSGNKRSETMMLRSALRRFQVRGMFDVVYDSFDSEIIVKHDI